VSIDLYRVHQLVRKEVAQLLRDIRTRMFIFASPIIQLLMFGYAVNTDIPGTALYVVDHDRTAVSRALVDAFTSTEYFVVVGTSSRDADLVRALDRGDAVLGLQVPPGFARELDDGGPAPLQLLLDGSQSNTATVAQGYATRILSRFAAQHSAPGMTPPAIDLRTRAWYNAALESRMYNVPAVIGLLILLMCLLLTALAVVREREFGTLDQLLVSPLTPTEFLLGKTLPVVLVALVDLLVISVVAVLWFGIPFRGSALVLLPAALCYILTGIALGLLISTISATQQEAFMTMFLFLLPAIILSGFFYPISSMPQVFQWITIVNPVRHFLTVVRSVFLKGGGFGDLWTQIAATGAIGVATMALALWRFSRSEIAR
jgi:ABC-2 type transport system permease protein